MKQNYFIYGEEPYLIDENIEKIKKQIADEIKEEPEINYIDADELNALQLSQFLEYSPLFSVKRLVIIKKPLWLDNSIKKQKNYDEIKQVLDLYFNQNYTEQTLIITARENNTTNSINKLINKYAQVIECKKPSSEYLFDWLKKEFEKNHKQVTPKALTLLVSSGNDMYYFKNLIDKICLINDKKQVNEKDIELELENRIEINVFKLTDALLNKDIVQSVKAFNQLLDQGNHPVFLLYMISRQYIDLAKVKSYKDQGYTKEQVEKNSDIKSFVVKKMMNKSDNFTWEEIKQIFNSLFETDVEFKTSGKDSTIIMETLIINLCK